MVLYRKLFGRLGILDLKGEVQGRKRYLEGELGRNIGKGFCRGILKSSVRSVGAIVVGIEGEDGLWKVKW